MVRVEFAGCERWPLSRLTPLAGPWGAMAHLFAGRGRVGVISCT